MHNFNALSEANVVFMMLATILVFFMTPGLAFFYGGLVSRKNSLTLMLQVFIAIGIVGVLWFLGGFSMVFGEDLGGVIGNPWQYFAFRNVTFDINDKYGSSIPFLMYFMYQLMFAIITLPLMTGSIVNRITMTTWVGLLILWMVFVYFPVAHWVWGYGWLSKLGFVDFAGGTVIHTNAAFSGLAALWVLGPRLVKDKKAPFNLGLVAIGSAILFFGWFGFNSGGALAADGVAAIAFTNTGMAMITAMIFWTIITVIKEKHMTFLDPLIGAVAGLATITPASGYVTPVGAIIIGAIAGVVCWICVFLVRRTKIDDVLDVWGCHGVGGALGTILIGIFADERVNTIKASYRQFGVQLLGVVVVACYTMFITWLIVIFLRRVCGARFTVTKEQVDMGLDKALLGEEYETEID